MCTQCTALSVRSDKSASHHECPQSPGLTCSRGIPWFTRYTKPIVRKASQIFFATSCRSSVDPWDTHGERSTIGMGPVSAILVLVNGCTGPATQLWDYNVAFGDLNSVLGHATATTHQPQQQRIRDRKRAVSWVPSSCSDMYYGIRASLSRILYTMFKFSTWLLSVNSVGCYVDSSITVFINIYNIYIYYQFLIG